MSVPLPTRALSDLRDPAQIQQEADALRAAFAAGDPIVTEEVRIHFRPTNPADFDIDDANLVLARAYGFKSSRALYAYVEGVTIARLRDVVCAGDAPTVRHMLALRPELINRDLGESDERQPLHFAVLSESAEMVRLLMQHGADARNGVWPHRDASSPYTLAIERGYSEIVAIIEQAEKMRPSEPAPRYAPFFEELPLSAAARQGDAREVERLLDSGYDPDERIRLENVEQPTFSSGRPLYSCAIQNNLAIANLLLQRGADPNARILASGTPMGAAYGSGHREMVALLERYGGVVYAANAGFYRDPALARRLFSQEHEGTLPVGVFEAEHGLADTLLISAASGGEPEIVRMALEHIDWEPGDPRWFWRMWHTLTFWNHMPGLPTAHPEFDRTTYLECFRTILARSGPNVRAERFGQTILHELATVRPHVTDEEVVAFANVALDAGARLDVRDDLLKSTPLGWACRWGRLELARLLLDRGADPAERDAEPWASPIAWADKRRHSALGDLLRSRL
jgi:ankyrin repeat protein